MSTNHMPYLLGEEEDTENESLLENAKRLAQKILLPHKITGTLINKYIRKAMQQRIWNRLPKETRILLVLARRLTRIKSPFMKQVIKNILLTIEQHTTRGKAIIYGIILYIRKTGQITSILKTKIHTILYLGITYLNNPPNLRVLG